MWSQALTRKASIFTDSSQDEWWHMLPVARPADFKWKSNARSNWKHKSKSFESPSSSCTFRLSASLKTIWIWLISVLHMHEKQRENAKNNGLVGTKTFNSIVPVPILQTQRGTAQLSFSLWRFIKNNWPNDKSLCCTAISSAVVTVIGKRLGSEKVTLPNKEGGWLRAPLLKINI